MYIILIDSGTTNTRIRLLRENETTVEDIEKVQVGVRNTAIEGTNETLKRHLYSGIGTILKRNGLQPSDIKYVIASGMITSNLGLYEVPHINGPAKVEDFSKRSLVIKMDEFFDLIWIFTPGLKNNPMVADITEEINKFDIMRGEEVETIGLLKQFDVQGKGVVILPGSHTKFIFISEDKALEYCLSTLGGETIYAIQQGTILSSSLHDEIINVVDEKRMYQGFKATEKYGLTRSFYHIRLLQMFSELTDNELANYYVGSILYSDLKSLQSTISESDIKWIIVGGAEPLRSSFTFLVDRMYSNLNIIKPNDEQIEKAIVLGPKIISASIKNINQSEFGGETNEEQK